MNQTKHIKKRRTWTKKYRENEKKKEKQSVRNSRVHDICIKQMLSNELKTVTFILHQVKFYKHSGISLWYIVDKYKFIEFYMILSLSLSLLNTFNKNQQPTHCLIALNTLDPFYNILFTSTIWNNFCDTLQSFFRCLFSTSVFPYAIQWDLLLAPHFILLSVFFFSFANSFFLYWKQIASQVCICVVVSL